MKNFGLKALALTMALILYFFVHSQTNSSVISLVVPIELRNLPKDRMVLLPALQQAQVTIKGPSFLLREVAISAPIFRIDLPQGVGDRYDLALTGEDLKLPSAIEVVSIIPPRMELILDKVVTKEVGVQVPKLGTLPEDLELKGIKIEPETVKATGPETELRGLTSVQSQPLNLSLVQGQTELTLALMSTGVNSKLSSDSVKVVVQVRNLSAVKSFKDLEIVLKEGAKEQLELMPRRAQILVEGPPSKLEELEANQLRLTVDANTANVTKGEAPIEVQLPEGFTVKEVKPERVKFVHKRVG